MFPPLRRGMAEGIILSCGNDAATTHEEIMSRYDDAEYDDYASDMHRFRSWQRAVRDDTPIEYWDHLDTSLDAFLSLEEEDEEAPE